MASPTARSSAAAASMSGASSSVPPTVVAYVQQKEGRQLSLSEAKELAHDYDQAAELAKYMIFDLDRAGDWPLCARKIGLAPAGRRDQVGTVAASCQEPGTRAVVECR